MASKKMHSIITRFYPTNKGTGENPKWLPKITIEEATAFQIKFEKQFPKPKFRAPNDPSEVLGEIKNVFLNPVDGWVYGELIVPDEAIDRVKSLTTDQGLMGLSIVYGLGEHSLI